MVNEPSVFKPLKFYCISSYLQVLSHITSAEKNLGYINFEEAKLKYAECTIIKMCMLVGIILFGFIQNVFCASMYTTPTLDDQFSRFRISNSIPEDGTSGVGSLQSRVRLQDAHPGKKFYTFKFKGEGNAQLLFQFNQMDEASDVVGVEIGGGMNNDMVAVYSSKPSVTSPNAAIAVPGITSAAEFREFWVTWDTTTGIFQFGTGADPTQNLVLQWNDLLSAVNFVSISTTSDNSGMWIFPVERELNGGCGFPLNFTCLGPNQECNEMPTSLFSSTCVCQDGFLPVEGVCTMACGSEFCGANEECIADVCECISPFERRPDGVCVVQCSEISCPANTDCEFGVCLCLEGFLTNDAGECVEACGEVLCGDNQECVADKCVCMDGFERNEDCECIPEADCEGCGSNEICTNDLMCKCDEGFIRDASETCSACSCPPGELCTINQGTGQLECACAEGFRREGVTCVPFVPDCSCPPGELCTINQTSGEIECSCNEGFRREGVACVQFLPDCSCPPGELCTINQTSGELECSCNEGFRREGVACVPFLPDCNCPVGELCTIQEDQLKCECGEGKERHTDGTCQSIPECRSDSDCVNEGELCGHGICECPSMHKLLPGICVKPGHLGGTCQNGKCFGKWVVCDVTSGMCVCKRGCAVQDVVCREKKRSRKWRKRPW